MDAELMTGYLAYSGTPDIVAEVQQGTVAYLDKLPSWTIWTTATFSTTIQTL